MTMEVPEPDWTWNWTDSGVDYNGDMISNR